MRVCSNVCSEIEGREGGGEITFSFFTFAAKSSLNACTEKVSVKVEECPCGISNNKIRREYWIGLATIG